MDIRNIAIIAHVDHGKTTLVDGLLKQTHTFRDNEAEMKKTTILDSGDLEREKGITILAKNTAIFYKGTKINIIDTPGHADFSGEIERVINMADGVLLVVDAAEGPLAQTQFVIGQAIENNLKIIIVVNKIDRSDARPQEVLKDTEDMILNLANDESHLDLSVIYAIGREGKAWDHYPQDVGAEVDLTPLLDKILSDIPGPKPLNDKPFKMLVSSLDFDDYKGTYAIGRIAQGTIRKGQRIKLMSYDKVLGNYKAEYIYTNKGLSRVEADLAQNGDIIAVSGIADVAIGQTLVDPADPIGFPVIKLTEPTLKITLSPNTSPLSGREGRFSTARQLAQRLEKEIKTNIGLIIKPSQGGTGFEVIGKGELHLAILIETLRREGYEMQVGKPQVILKTVDKITMEPYEEVNIQTDEKYIGVVVKELGRRKAEILDIKKVNEITTKFHFMISTRNLLGLRGLLISETSGSSIIASRFIKYDKAGDAVSNTRPNGVLVSFESGVSTAYALETVQNRGTAFIGPGEKVYEGMIIGLNNRDEDLDINVCKSKKLTNMHTENSDIAIQIDPPVRLTLEQCLDFIEDDELLEVTPESLRLRKKHLSKIDRLRAKRQAGTSGNNAD